MARRIVITITSPSLSHAVALPCLLPIPTHHPLFYPPPESATSVSSYDREEMAPPTSVSSDDGAEAALPHPQSSTCITTPTCGVDLTHTFGNFYFGESGLMTVSCGATLNTPTNDLPLHY